MKNPTKSIIQLHPNIPCNACRLPMTLFLFFFSTFSHVLLDRRVLVAAAVWCASLDPPPPLRPAPDHTLPPPSPNGGKGPGATTTTTAPSPLT